MVALRGRVVVETSLIGLNRAILGGVDQSPADQQWLHAWKEQIVEEGSDEAWREERLDGTLHGKARADGERRHKDHMSACKDILEGVGMRIRDARPWAVRRGGRRRWRDASIAAMLRAAPPDLLLGPEEAALATALDVQKARDVYAKSWARATGGARFLSELLQPDGRTLPRWGDGRAQSHRTPPWFAAIERICGVRAAARAVAPEWRCTPAGGEAGAQEEQVAAQVVGTGTTADLDVVTTQSAVRVLQRVTGEREVVGARERVRASGIGNGYRHEDDVRDLRDVGTDLAADATGGGRVAGFAWCTTYLEEGERKEEHTHGTA